MKIKHRISFDKASVIIDKISFKRNCFLCFIIFFICMLSGCDILKHEEAQEEYNPVLENSNFRQAFENHSIILIAPGSATSSDRIEKLKKLDFLNIKVPETLFKESIPYHSNEDNIRFNLLKQALEKGSQDTIVWAVRGGYGTARLLDALNKVHKPLHERIVIGFSDLTALHLFLSQKWNWKPIHGSMLNDLLNPKKDPKNFEKLADIISQSVSKAEINNLIPLNTAAKNMVTISGRITGGNVTIVETSIGTDWEIQTRDKILFFEDEGEKGSRIDRSLNHLKQAGLLQGVKAIIFGEFTNSDEFQDFSLQRFADEVNIPVFKTDEFGHGVKNYPIIYNAKSTIQKANQGESFDLIMQIKD